MQDSMFIVLDIHKATISVALAAGERRGEVRHWGTVPHRPDNIQKLVDKLGVCGGKLHFCYEAGPCGYGIHRQLTEMGHDCMVAKLYRAGKLTEVWVLDAAHEAMRDLVRARATCSAGSPAKRASIFRDFFCAIAASVRARRVGRWPTGAG